ncbi:hypothetical protein VTL71DRAFT_10781 [Oculimacula yallundae]|uniref:MYND-type domain-containing protein n=1 Tax=Oculimacula yallundae TaxID=86028 RepID=A0ABR4CV38_9HELO
MSVYLATGCPLCRKADKLLRCEGCKSVFYCSEQHRAADRAAHKGACTAVKKAEIRYNKAEELLRNPPRGLMIPPNLFENEVGHFWDIVETRSYMRARFWLVEALGKIRTQVAVQEALKHALDLLRLNRSDNLGVRSAAPALFMRLGKDQECYNFIKWWETHDPDSTYDWADLTLIYLSTKNANPLESEEIFLGQYGKLSIAVTVVLIKLRLLLEVKSLQNVTLLRSRLPSEILRDIQDIIAGPVLAKNRDIMSSADQRFRTTTSLESQIDHLYQNTIKINTYFWPALIEPGSNLIARPEYFHCGTEEEMQISLQQCYDSWAETPGAIDFVREKL